jgi:antitoxin HigA-1
MNYYLYLSYFYMDGWTIFISFNISSLSIISYCSKNDKHYRMRFMSIWIGLFPVFSKDIGVSPRRINEIIHGRRAITADTALRLGRFFSMEGQFWLNLQSHYDMEVAMETLQDRLEKEVHPFPRAA